MNDSTPAIGMDDNRLRHCRGVGMKASELGAPVGWSDDSAARCS